MNLVVCDARQCTLPLNASPAVLSPVRRIIGAHLDLWGLPHLTDTAQLVVTELLTNVIRHVPDPRCTVAMRCLDEGIEIAVHDCDTRFPRARSADEFAEDGRGLTILMMMTDSLRVEPYGATGKVVRCEFGGTCRGE